MKCSRNGKKFVFWKDDDGNVVYVHGERDSRLIRARANPAALLFEKDDTRVFRRKKRMGDSDRITYALQHVETGYFVGRTNQEDQITLQSDISDAVEVDFD